MLVNLTTRPNAAIALERLERWLDDIPHRIVACSGGIDSLLLATVAHRASATGTTIAHTVTPAVPGDGTARVRDFAAAAGWALHVVESAEFDDERYLSNPADRCYFCKSNLYDAIAELRSSPTLPADAVILSGANVDDLGEYRPGLAAAAEREVRHPYVEVGIGKAEIRAIARSLGLREAELAASPCLASRLYTGTRVTASRLAAVEAGEALVRERTGLAVVRCRVRESAVLVEVPDADRSEITPGLLAELEKVMQAEEPELATFGLDADAYEPGRAFLHDDR